MQEGSCINGIIEEEVIIYIDIEEETDDHDKGHHIGTRPGKQRLEAHAAREEEIDEEPVDITQISGKRSRDKIEQHRENKKPVASRLPPGHEYQIERK